MAIVGTSASWRMSRQSSLHAGYSSAYVELCSIVQWLRDGNGKPGERFVHRPCAGLGVNLPTGRQAARTEVDNCIVAYGPKRKRTTSDAVLLIGDEPAFGNWQPATQLALLLSP